MPRMRSLAGIATALVLAGSGCSIMRVQGPPNAPVDDSASAWPQSVLISTSRLSGSRANASAARGSAERVQRHQASGAAHQALWYRR